MKNKIFNAQETMELIARNFDAGYFHALNGIRSVILLTGKTEATISVELIDAMIFESKKQLEAMKHER
jgi:hypothetical protein